MDIYICQNSSKDTHLHSLWASGWDSSNKEIESNRPEQHYQPTDVYKTKQPATAEVHSEHSPN